MLRDHASVDAIFDRFRWDRGRQPATRLSSPGSRPRPMWQEAQARRLGMNRIRGSGASGPRYCWVCARSRLPYSGVAAVWSLMANDQRRDHGDGADRRAVERRPPSFLRSPGHSLHIGEKAILGPFNPCSKSRRANPGGDECQREHNRDQNDRDPSLSSWLEESLHVACDRSRFRHPRAGWSTAPWACPRRHRVSRAGRPRNWRAACGNSSARSETGRPPGHRRPPFSP